jgi:16S rRNA G966 N2-methylase RsmD
MRIISGEFRSRKLHTPKDAETTRPIPDRVKESIFQLLRGHYEGVEVFDGFAGTGAQGLEALSRGAKRCVFVERDREIAKILQRNIDELGVRDRADLIVGDVLGPGALARCPRPAHLIFMDPPYPLVEDPTGWKRVKVQFERLIQNLDDGYAILRTPWPFEHVLPGQGEEKSPMESREERKGKWADKDKRHSRDEVKPKRKHEWDQVWSIEKNTKEELEEIEVAEDAVPATNPDGSPILKETVSLVMAGAKGPETHVFRNTAVHLYMKG